jgi:hypothetical protein
MARFLIKYQAANTLNSLLVDVERRLLRRKATALSVFNIAACVDRPDLCVLSFNYDVWQPDKECYSFDPAQCGFSFIQSNPPEYSWAVLRAWSSTATNSTSIAQNSYYDGYGGIYRARPGCVDASAFMVFLKRANDGTKEVTKGEEDDSSGEAPA